MGSFLDDSILRLVVTLGYDLLLVREVAVLAPNGNWAQLQGLVRRCNQTVIGVSLVALPLAAGLGALFAGPGSSQFAALAVGLLSLPLVSLMTMRQAVVQGLSRIITSRLPEDLVYPVIFLALVVGVHLLSPETLDATVATGLRVASVALALGLAVILVRRYLPEPVGPAEYDYELKRLAASSIPLVIIGSANVFVVEFGTIVVGAAVSSVAAGGYAVAVKVTFTLTLIEFAANQALGPIVANLHVRGEHRRLQSALTKTARAVVGLAALGGALIIVFAAPILAFFGPDYSGSENVLRVLVGRVVAEPRRRTVRVTTGHDWSRTRCRCSTHRRRHPLRVPAHHWAYIGFRVHRRSPRDRNHHGQVERGSGVEILDRVAARHHGNRCSGRVGTAD